MVWENKQKYLCHHSDNCCQAYNYLNLFFKKMKIRLCCILRAVRETISSKYCHQGQAHLLHDENMINTQQMLWLLWNLSRGPSPSLERVVWQDSARSDGGFCDHLSSCSTSPLLEFLPCEQSLFHTCISHCSCFQVFCYLPLKMHLTDLRSVAFYQIQHHSCLPSNSPSHAKKGQHPRPRSQLGVEACWQ